MFTLGLFIGILICVFIGLMLSFFGIVHTIIKNPNRFDEQIDKQKQMTNKVNEIEK